LNNKGQRNLNVNIRIKELKIEKENTYNNKQNISDDANILAENYDYYSIYNISTKVSCQLKYFNILSITKYALAIVMNVLSLQNMNCYY